MTFHERLLSVRTILNTKTYGATPEEIYKAQLVLDQLERKILRQQSLLKEAEFVLKPFSVGLRAKIREELEQ